MTGPPSKRYQLCCYVSMTGQVRRAGTEGSQRFIDIYVMAPDGYRWAVTGGPPFMLYDLWGCVWGAQGWLGPGVPQEFPTLDAAVMAGVIQK